MIYFVASHDAPLIDERAATCRRSDDGGWRCTPV